MDTGQVRVLLVDDDEDDYVLTRDWFSQMQGDPFKLEWVESYDAALEAIARHQHDVYLFDYRLGERTGLELLREAVAKGCSTPIILLTGQGDHEVDIEAMKAGAADYLEKSQIGAPLLERSIRYAIERKRTEEALRQQAERERLLVEIAQRIRQSLNLTEILNTTVSEVRQFLQVERVFIYRFELDWGGLVVVESLGSDNLKPILGSRLKDPSFAETSLQRYKQGRIQATADIYAADLTQCYINFMAEFQVRAALVVPILQGEDLWGLLVANHCSAPRQWQQLEINLLKQLATQVAIAIQQSTLFEQAQTDLAERKQAEQKIREQAALLDVATDAIFVRDLEKNILFWNKGAERLYGWKAEEAIGKNANQLLYQETFSQQLKEAQLTLAHTGEWQGELHQVTKDGKQIIVQSRWTLVRDEQEKPKSILVVNTDITEKKQLEAQFLRAQRLESIGTLASGIAHDLNNVLAPILMTAQLLETQLHDQRSQRLLPILVTNAKRGAALVKQVLSFARGVEGTCTILQIKHLVAEIRQIVKETFPKSIEIYTDIPSNLWTVSGDATQLHQVLMNLCVNARDAMLNGGTLKICAENLFIDEHYARMHLEAKVGPYIVITVADTGTGIPPEIVERIFEPFFTTKELGKGTGLGLSTVMGIIKSHGGFITVYSEMGRGTAFKVYLPAVEAMEPLEVPDAELPLGNGELILVVDDEAAIREITKTSLETYNYKAITASDGIEAIALYAEHRDQVSVVLTDMLMPSMDGATTIRTLQKINPNVKIIAVSGLASTDKQTTATSAGVKTFLSKPYTAKELLSAINRVLSNNHQSTTARNSCF
jgi:PAS domain S-box-containing protein